jgi:hypothetical protein
VSAARCVPGAVLAAALLACSGRPVPEPAPGPSAKQLVVSPGLVVERACTPTGPELCFNARDDNCNGIIDEGCGVHTGLVQFIIAWDEPQADVDLLVTDPNGELVEVGATSQSGLIGSARAAATPATDRTSRTSTWTRETHCAAPTRSACGWISSAARILPST